MAHRAHRTSHRTTVRYEYLLIGPPAPACIKSRQSRVYLVIVAAAFSTPTTYQPTKREMRSPPSHLRISLCCKCVARAARCEPGGWGRRPTTWARRRPLEDRARTHRWRTRAQTALPGRSWLVRPSGRIGQKCTTRRPSVPGGNPRGPPDRGECPACTWEWAASFLTNTRRRGSVRVGDPAMATMINQPSGVARSDRIAWPRLFVRPFARLWRRPREGQRIDQHTDHRWWVAAALPFEPQPLPYRGG